MGRSGKKGRGSGFNVPFRDLKRRLEPLNEKRSEAKDPLDPPAPAPSSDTDDDALFREAMAGVSPLEARRPRRASPGSARSRRKLPRQPPDPEAEAYAALADLVSGNVPFDIADTDEYVEGHVKGLDQNVLRKLRRGEFAIQAHLDLHGLSRQEARRVIDRFVTKALVAGHRCVLIVHGRGRHSPDKVPVLKDVVRAWLSRGRIGRAVLAFTSARPVDGGSGALYVLLRRNSRR